jgi:hypothetical protein
MELNVFIIESFTRLFIYRFESCLDEPRSEVVLVEWLETVIEIVL